MGGWIVGWSIGGVVVLVLVAILLTMIRGATRAGVKAANILAALEESRDNTAGLWAVDTTNKTARRITTAATSARLHIESKGSQ